MARQAGGIDWLRRAWDCWIGKHHGASQPAVAEEIVFVFFVSTDS